MLAVPFPRPRGTPRDRGPLSIEIRSTINRDLILSRWDDLLRLAAPLKIGWATISLLVGKLQSFRRQNALLRVLQEHGRLI